MAVVTGASAGIGFELARQCSRHGHELLIAADEPAINDAVAMLRNEGATIDAAQANLSGPEGVDRLVAALGRRPAGSRRAPAGVPRRPRTACSAPSATG